MRKWIVLVTFAVCNAVCGQTNVPEGMTKMLRYDKRLSGANCTSYFTLYDYLEKQGETRLTPTPKGYEAFYISAYLRHGSRWLTEKYMYDWHITMLQEEAQRDNLTEKGKALLRDVKRLKELCPNEKLGVLTDIGAEQHREIARRMCRNFPEVMNRTGDFYAQSSVVKRCVRSMNAEAEVIEQTTGASVRQESGRKGMQERIAGHYTNKTMDAWRSKGNGPHSQERKQLTPYKRLAAMLFKNPEAVAVDKKQRLSRAIFDLAENMQSHDFDLDFWQYYNQQEMEQLLTIKNRHWYRMFGPSPLSGGMMPLRSKWQLEDIIAAADTVVSRRQWHGVNLRFGHDTALMPLICLMQLGTSGRQIPESEIGTLETFWRNHEMFPMAGNIQLIFYRPKNGEGSILMKALLNEREVTLPGTPVTGCYYRWEEVCKNWRIELAKL